MTGNTHTLRIHVSGDPIPHSYQYQVQVMGEGDHWYSNSVRFATPEEADQAGRAKYGAWTLCAAYRVMPSDDPVNYRWDGGLVSVAR